jgi:peptidoglycan/xylan/chitin deacetylase (PgdA/CDA1 family)
MTSLRSKVRHLAYTHVGGTAVVLIYHRVAELERDPQLLAVSPERFDTQMKLLSERYNVIPLAELLDGVERRRVPHRSVAVTFDDGYADNLTTAEPILAAHGVPATIFACSGYVESGREYWWDELEQLLLSPGTLPPHLALETSCGRFSAELSDAITYTPEDARCDARWTVLAAESNSRQALYKELATFLRPLSAVDHNTALGQLRTLAIPSSEAGAFDQIPRSTHRPLTADEIAMLDASAVVDVGAHTRNHTVLSARTLQEQTEEILADRDDLAAICGREMRTFSYPYGALTDYTDETVRLVREAGFSGACSNHPGVVKPWTDPFRVPRNLVRDWDAQTLADRIEGWFGGSR